MKWQARLLALLALFPGIVEAADSDPVVKDLRKNEAGSNLFVAFCARDVAPGHAFIVLGNHDENKELCSVEALGFYPKDGKGIVGPVPGEVANEFLKPRSVPRGACRLILQVSKEQYEAAERVRMKWANRKYQLLESDCVSFSKEIAKVLHLKIPDDGAAKHPQLFVNSLIKMNK